MDDQQLRWAASNGYNRGAPGGRRGRRPGPGVEPAGLGELARRALDGLAGPAGRYRSLIAVLEEHGAGEVLRQADIDGLYNGVLTFRVPEPAVACYLRLTWEQRLLAVLRGALPGAGVHTIRFVVGRRRCGPRTGKDE
jgi:hypothetical protein